MLWALRGAILAGTCLTACSETRNRAGLTHVLSADDPPADFTLAVTVRSRPGSDPAHLNPSHRPARYVMEADWILRAAIGPGASEDTFPPRTRQLSFEQVRRLWRDLRDSGLLEEPALSPVEAELVYTLHYSADGSGRTLRLDGANFAGAERLVGDLAALAWVTD
jgi:hypothetical protein